MIFSFCRGSVNVVHNERAFTATTTTMMMMTADHTVTTTTSTYIVLIPRGLEHVVCEMLQQQQHHFHPNNRSSRCATHDHTAVISISTKIVGEEERLPCDSSHGNTSSFVTNVRKKLQSHHDEYQNKRKRRHQKETNTKETTNHIVTSPEVETIPTIGSNHKNTNNDNNNNNININNNSDIITKINQVACARLVGTMEYTPHQHVSIGYTTTTSTTPVHTNQIVSSTNTTTITTTTHTIKDIWSVPGQMSGLVWIEITIDRSCCCCCCDPCELRDVVLVPPPHSGPTVIPNHIRYLGPIVAVVAVYDSTTTTSSSNNNILLQEHQSVKEAGEQIQSIIRNDSNYEQKFHHALQLWRQHVQDCWPEVLDQYHSCHSRNAKKSTSVRTTGHDVNAPLKYRISCLRNDSKKYGYTRRELLRHIDGIIPSSSLYDTYTVDLTNYDLEIVLCYRPRSFLIGLAVRPYQYIGSGKSFASGELPPDITSPIMTSLSHVPRVVRLRPSTAQILLYLANLQPSDIVLDPCVGIGTIPIETRIQYGNHVFAIGGDLAMNDPSFQAVTVDYLRRASSSSTAQPQCGSCEQSVDRHIPIPDLLAWDATQIPIRSESIDVIVTDLPFGQLCMSAVKLDAFLPLIMAEMARVLRPITGRIVLLCGSYIAVLRCLIYANDCLVSTPNELIWDLPCTAVFPVNIGGNLAWVVQVRRSSGRPIKLADQRDKIRKQVQKREHTEKMMLGSKVSKMKHPQS